MLKKIRETIKNKIHDFLFPPIEKCFRSTCIVEKIPSPEELEEGRKMLEEYEKSKKLILNEKEKTK